MKIIDICYDLHTTLMWGHICQGVCTILSTQISCPIHVCPYLNASSRPTWPAPGPEHRRHDGEHLQPLLASPQGRRRLSGHVLPRAAQGDARRQVGAGQRSVSSARFTLVILAFLHSCNNARLTVWFLKRQLNFLNCVSLFGNVTTPILEVKPIS